MCATPTTVEFHRDVAYGTVLSLNSSLTLPHWMSVGKNFHVSPVISASVESALRTIR